MTRNGNRIYAPDWFIDSLPDYPPMRIAKSVLRSSKSIILSCEVISSVICAEAYMIENGKITHPVKGATLIGSGIEAMQQVSMVGNDLSIDRGVGVCGKAGQSVPVGVGQPTLKLDSLTVGGTE